jgi:hypothetical protein
MDALAGAECGDAAVPKVRIRAFIFSGAGAQILVAFTGSDAFGTNGASMPR